MPFNPKNTRHVNKLRTAMAWSEKRQEPFRRQRRYAYEQYVGFHYGSDSARDRVPVGLIAQMCDVYLRSIIARNPRILVKPTSRNNPDLTAEAATTQADINEWVKDLDLQEKFRCVALDAILSPFGLLKVGLADNGVSEIFGQPVPVTRPFAEPVHLEHFVIDMAAQSWHKADFMGNRYRLPLEVAKNLPLWDKDAREKLTVRPKAEASYENDYDLEEFSQGDGDPDEYNERTEVWDIWLPEEKLVVTLPYGEGSDVLSVIEWDGPEEGPFHQLSFRRIPNNVMPVAPVLNSSLDLHELVNSIFNKMARQVDREKIILGYRGTAKEDAERVVNSSDGQSVLQNDGNLQEIRFGGAQSSSVGFMLQAQELFNRLGGNIEVLGGLAPAASTLGQEQMMAGSASKMIADMQDQMTGFVRSVIRSLRWYHWTDPIRRTRPVKRVQGTDIEIEGFWSPETRKGKIMDYEYDVDVYSMQEQTPQGRLQTLMQVVQTLIFPGMQAMQQQGITLDMETLLKLVAEYTDVPEIKDILTFPNESAEPSRGSELSRQATKSPFSQREYVRRNVSDSSSDGRMSQAMALMNSNKEASK